ncbi:hypothetical protein F01_230073 [Burkholderia cenocepacia]|nr:hypothetical protein F01_230073 [Burkholderia cenocepacia]
MGARRRDDRFADHRGLACRRAAREPVGGARRAAVAGRGDAQPAHALDEPRRSLAAFPREARVRALGRADAGRLYRLRNPAGRRRRRARARVRPAGRIPDLPDAAAHARPAARARRAGAARLSRGHALARGAAGRARCDAPRDAGAHRMARGQPPVPDGAADRDRPRIAADAEFAEGRRGRRFAGRRAAREARLTFRRPAGTLVGACARRDRAAGSRRCARPARVCTKGRDHHVNC